MACRSHGGLVLVPKVQFVRRGFFTRTKYRRRLWCYRQQPLSIQYTESPCLFIIYFLNFFLFRAFHSPSCVARLLKSCFTFRFLSASLKKKSPSLDYFLGNILPFSTSEPASEIPVGPVPPSRTRGGQVSGTKPPGCPPPWPGHRALASGLQKGPASPQQSARPGPALLSPAPLTAP